MTTPIHPVVHPLIEDGYHTAHFYNEDLIKPLELISPFMPDTTTTNSNTTTFSYKQTPDKSITFVTKESSSVWYPEMSKDWKCELFGTGEALVLTPRKDKVPNWFWRKMQYLAFGNKWIKTTSS